jgi:hypothetical protein
MGSKETRRIPKHACIGRLVIVALSAQPPGVNELCVCVCTGTNIPSFPYTFVDMSMS